MNKETSREWYEAYKLLEQKKKQKQDDFNAVGLKLAREELKRKRMTFRECKAWADWCDALPREQTRPTTSPVASLASWLLPIG